MHENEPDSVSAALAEHICAGIAQAGGWVPFDRFMHWALYTPGLGYYSGRQGQIGASPATGSDFVTAPVLSPLFGRALAAQVRQGLDAAASGDVWEFGAGTGALAEQLLHALGERIQRYTIVDISGSLRAQQQQRLAPFGARVEWVDRLPASLHGVVLGNEVLDAMPARLLTFDGQRWQERGVALHAGRFTFADVPSADRPPLDDLVGGAFDSSFDSSFAPGTVTEIHPQAEAFIATLGERLQRGLVLFFDYGFPQAEYYHPQRTGGTLMCHRAHLADGDPLVDVGRKDITVHVNFTGIALAAQAAGLDVLGYTSQARFLFNCGLAQLMQDAPVAQAVAAHKLVAEHEMGELFKVIALGRGITPGLLGFAEGDRTHRL